MPSTYGSAPLLQVWPNPSMWLASAMSLVISPVTVTGTVVSSAHRESAVTFRS